jgi:hypothetical protein
VDGLIGGLTQHHRCPGAASLDTVRWQSWQWEEALLGVVAKSARGLACWQAGQCFQTGGWTGGHESVGSTCIDTSFLVFADEGRSMLAPAVLAHRRGRLVLRRATGIAHMAPFRTASVKLLRRYVKCY